MKPLRLYGKRFREADCFGGVWDPKKVDLVVSADRKWPIMGIVFDSEPLMLDWRTFTSFRVKPGNFGFVKRLRFVNVNQDIDKEYLKTYFLENQDNPYGLYSVITTIRNERRCHDLTQFPPLQRMSRSEEEWRGKVQVLLSQIRQGDAIFSGSYREEVSSTIRYHDRCQFSHVAIHVGNGEVVDIGPGGAVLNSLLDYDWHTYLAAYRPKDSTPDRGEQAARDAFGTLARCRGYDWLSVFAVFLRERFRLPIARRLRSNKDLLYANTLELVAYVT